jgi:hypothetical protein
MKDEKGIALIVGRLAKKKDDSEEGSSEEESGEGYTAAAEEVMEAMKSGDPEGFAKSLKAFVAMCQAEG